MFVPTCRHQISIIGVSAKHLLVIRKEQHDSTITRNVLLDVREGWAGYIFWMWVYARLFFFIVWFILLTP